MDPCRGVRQKITIERQVGQLALLHQLSELLHAEATIFVEVKPAEDSVYLAGVKLLGYLKNQLFDWQGSLQYSKWVTRKTFPRRGSVADEIFLLFVQLGPSPKLKLWTKAEH